MSAARTFPEDPGAPPFVGASNDTGDEARSPSPIKWIGSDAIFEPLPPIPRIVDGLDIVHGRPTLIVAFGSGGKTLAIQSATLSLAAGLPVWGHFLVPRPIRVGHADLDQGEYADRRRYQRLAAGLGITSEQVRDRLFLSVMPRLHLHEASAEDLLVRVIETQGLELLWLDAYRRLIPGLDENDSRAAIGLETCTRASERTRVPIVVLHHSGKADDDDSPQKATRGTSALYDSAGGIYKFSGNPGEPKRVRHARPSALHEGPLGEDFSLEIVGEPGGPLAVKYLVRESAPRPKSASAVYDAVKVLIRAHLAKHPDEHGADVLAEKIGRNKQSVRTAVKEMLSKGEIANLGTDKRPRLRLGPAT